jgi:hypothetical protein
VARLDDGHDGQRRVDPAVAGAREPVALLLAGGGVQGGGAVPGREVIPAGEPVDVADVGPAAGQRRRGRCRATGAAWSPGLR